MNPITQHLFPPDIDAFLVGGCVRDLLLDRVPEDYDLAVLGDGKRTAQKIARHTKGHLIELGKPDFILYRIISDRAIVDVQAIKGESIEDDLSQRDFTINAMACHIASNRIIDVHDGRIDLGRKTIRMTSEAVFKRDPVRLIRAFRLSAALQFKIEDQTQQSIRSHAREIGSAAGERIREELFQLIGNSQSNVQFAEMARSNLLFEIFPALFNLLGCTRNRFHSHLGSSDSLPELCNMEHILESVGSILPDVSYDLENILYDSYKLPLKLTALFHDMCKSNNRNGDDADSICAIAERLKLSNQQRQFIERMIGNKKSPFHLFQSERQNRSDRTARIRFFMKNKEMTPALLLHALADRIASNNGQDETFQGFINRLLKDFFRNFNRIKDHPKLLTGDDLIREFNLTPSPLFKTILTVVEEKRLIGEITTKSDALSLAEMHLHSGKPSCGP